MRMTRKVVLEEEYKNLFRFIMLLHFSDESAFKQTIKAIDISTFFRNVR
jgi:hypothetical protein